ncbi:M48 family metallopeptidase [Streptomyces sp. NPDC096079]|uniref:M48 family metallopeptidase n=1 Tax=Streptomyces sp. NPDC096079 TaxID=3155820 RepID=UPI00332D47F4
MRTTTGPSAQQQSVEPCPECGADVPVDERFVRWCAACDWNVDPHPPEPPKGRIEETRRALARRHGERLLAEMTDAGEPPRPRRDPSALLAYGLALAVHGLTVAVLVAGVWLTVAGPAPGGKVVGVLLLLIAWSLRPRRRKLPEDAHLLHRPDAPELYALVDQVAATVGTRSVDVIAVDADVNASVTTYGIRGRRLLTLGLPLWESLTPQERIALLGHELGHYSHGDVRQGRVLTSAYRSLSLWAYYTAPTADPTLVEMAVNLFYLVPRTLVNGLTLLLDQLTLRATQRAEYLADAAAARTASTEAAVGLMDRLLVGSAAHTVLRREVNRAATRTTAHRSGPRRAAEERPERLWEAVAAHVASIPESEYARRRRAGAIRGHAVDATHPPTHLRRAALLAGPASPAAVTADAARTHRLDAELAPLRTAVAQGVIRDVVR